MTNAESYLQAAIEKMNNNELTSTQENFVASIENYSKKELRGLTSTQFKMLREIANY